MRECKIILPTKLRPTGGYPTGDDIHAMVRRTLALDFGGYTVTHGDGGWIDGHGDLIEERVTIYVVALADEATPERKFRQLVDHLHRNAGEETIYHVGPDGLVSFT